MYKGQDFSSTTPPQLRFEDVRNAPFLDGDSSAYFCSIVRFSLQVGNLLPVFIPKMDTTANDPVNTSMYKISFAYRKINATYPPTTTRFTTTSSVMYKATVPCTIGSLPVSYSHTTLLTSFPLNDPNGVYTLIHSVATDM